MQYNHVMVDLETTGTIPDHTAIIQLAAVKFNLEELTIDLNMFDQCMGVPPTRFWQEDTRDWWATQDEHIIEGIWKRMRDPRTVMNEFADWCGRGQKLILWAKPTAFEQPFLQSYCREFSVEEPFNYWETKDLRSVQWARGRPNLDREMVFEGDKHNALQDTLHQVAVLFELMNTTNYTVSLNE